MKVFAFSGSLRTGSFNEQLLAVATRALREKGVEVDQWNFKAANVPVYDPDVHDTNQPAGIVDFKTRVRAATGLMVVSPEYNHSLPGALKNLLDFASRPPNENPFRGKLAVQLGATPGNGGTLQAQLTVRHVLSSLGCLALPGTFTVSRAAEALDGAGLKDAGQTKTLSGFLDRFVEELKLRSR